MYSAGTAYLTVVPSFRGIEQAFRREAENLGRQVDRSIAEAIPNGVREGAERAERNAQRQGRSVGEKFAGAFSDTLTRRLDNMVSSIRITGDKSDVDEALADVRKDLIELRDAHVNLEVDSDFAMLELRRLAQRLRELSRGEHTVEVHVNIAQALSEADAIEQAIQNSQDSIERAHREAFAEDERRTRDRMRMLNEAHAEDERRERDKQRLLRDAYAENERFDREREQRQRDYHRMLSDAYAEDERRTRDKLRMLREAYAENERFDRERSRRQGGAMGEQARRRTSGARDSLPDLDPALRTSNVHHEIARIRAEFDRLANLTIDVDIPAAQYMRQIAALEAALEAVERNEIDIPTDIDLGNIRAARAEIQALTAAAGREGNDAGDEWGGSFVRNLRQHVRTAAATISDIPLSVDTTEAQFEIQELRARLLALGNVRIGIDMDMASFIREATMIENRLADLEMSDVDIQTRLEAAAARMGLTALQQQINAVDRDDIEIDVDTNGGMMGLRNLAQTAGLTMSRLGLLISLGASIGTAIVPAAAAAAASISAIATAASAAAVGVGVFALGIFGPIKALAALNQYQKDADKSAQNLSATQARVAGALDQVEGAAAGVRSAERNLIKAQRDAVESTKELVRAREEARRQLEDMTLAVRSNALAQRQARLDEADAKKELDKILANPRATEAEREQARITHEQRLLQIEELGIRQGRLVADEAEARQKGIEGSDQVKAAQERIAAAMERVVSAQESVAASHRSLEAANRSLQQAYEKTGVAGGDAMRNLKEAMDALSPAGRRFALFLFSLKDEFKGLQAAAETGLLPGLEQGIKNLLPYLEPLKTLIGNVAKALGDGFVAATEALKEPIWQSFFSYLAQTAVPTLKGMFTFFGNVARGVAGVLLGLSGFNGPIGQGMLKWSEDFARWGTTLDSNKGWQKFIQYVKDSWPEVRDFFSGLWDFTKKFVAAAAPIGEWVIGAFAKLFEWMNKLDTETWTAIIAGIAGLGAALLVAAGVTAAITTGTVGAVIAAVVAAVVAIGLLYAKFEPFQKAVDTTLKAVGAAWNWLWNDVIKPGATAFGEGFQKLRHDILEPWGLAVKSVFDAFGVVLDKLRPVISFFVDNAMMGFRFLGDVLLWLWHHVGEPVFDFFLVIFKIVYAAFQVFLGLFQIGVKIWAAMFTWIWDKAIQPLWEKVKPFFLWLGEVIKKHVYPPFKEWMEKLGKVWDLFVEATKVPIKIVVNTLLNDGLLAGYNKIAKFFGVKPDDVKIDLPKGFAHGGAVWGPGTATSDSILARLSRGEHVWTAKEVEAAGGHEAVLGLRRKVLQGMKLDGLLPGFKGGGPVDWFNRAKKAAGNVIGGVKDFFSDPTGTLKKLLENLVNAVPERGLEVMKVALGVPNRVLQFALDKVKDVFSGDGGTPGNWPSGPGAQRGDSGVWRSIVALIRSSGINQGTFGNSYRHGDPLWHGSGRAVDWMGYNMDALATFLAARRPLELIHRTNTRDYAYTRGRNVGSFNNQLMEEHRNHIHVAMDQGGWLQPGITSIFNGTGVPEPVLTSRQWSDIHALARSGAPGGPTYQFEFRDTTLDPGKLRALQDREDARTRQGRAR